MLRMLHRIAAITALLCVALFITATLFAELSGSEQAVARIKHLIVSPGLWIMVPAMALTGASGFLAARSRSGRILDRKRRRMQLLAANGLLVLVPCALLLDRWAAQGALDGRFYLLQAVEIVAGLANLLLITRNMVDGLRLTRARRPLQADA